MCKGWHASFQAARISRHAWAPLAALLALLVAGCGTVAISVEDPPGTRVELCEKAKWFGSFGPDWGTGWDKVVDRTVGADDPCDLRLEADGSWLESVITCFPRQYRARFDLSGMATYEGTPGSMVEVRYVREVVPPKYQEIIRLWRRDRTMDVLTHLPVDVLADVLYNLGDHFTRMLQEEVEPAKIRKAAADLKTLLEASTTDQPPSPKEVESWLKSFLNVEQLRQICRWVRNGVHLEDVKWVRLGGPRPQKNPPVFWVLTFGFLDLFIRQPEIRTTRVDFFEDVILRDLLVRKVETKLVNVERLRLYAEIKAYHTTYFTDRVMPGIDLIQDIGLASIVRPTADQEKLLKMHGMTRSTPLNRDARGQAIRDGLPPVGLKTTQVTAFQSQVIGAVLDRQLAYVIIWNNPRKTDPVRYLTTVVTTDPYGMARIWTYRGGEELCVATSAFSATEAPLGGLASWVASVLDQRALFVKLETPVAVIAFGNRPLAPWSDMPASRPSRIKAVRELEPVEESAE